MTTAVASPQPFQSLSRLGWNTGNHNGQGMNSDDRMFMPRKSVQRSSSSSSLSSQGSTTTTVSATPSSHTTNGSQPSLNGSSDARGTWAATKKAKTRNLWPSSKAEATSGVTNARTQPISSTAGATASSAMSALHTPSPLLPSQHLLQSQQNGVRGAAQPQSEPPAVLSLLPMNGTFERKQITVPFYPDVLRIGRQTNAKTVPTATNGFFDSKVLSRQHAEVWADRSGKIWIRDVKSSNGTFVNGQRLSPENRDSEPHELREHDMLELGIDIVSEDQKTIVHHKVSAKVEHAGVYGGSTNVLDLNYGDIDPMAGGGLLPSPLSNAMAHMRGRPGSVASMNGRLSGPPSIAGSQMNPMMQQRQMNYWVSPVTIEQVVKKLTSEMKQAKQQSMDLGQTNDFLGCLLSNDPEKEKTSPLEPNQSRQVNGKAKLPRIDPVARFSEPPAPPPQLPLPEKPDAARSPVDGIPRGLVKRSDTEKPTLPGASPISRESPSQVLSLVDALNAAKKEIESQGSRVKQLEELLSQERAARVEAEERAKQFETQQLSNGIPSSVDGADGKAEESEKDIVGDNLKASEHDGTSAAPVPEPAALEASAQRLQQRLELMMVEMDDMKQQMEKYRVRAETAEEERQSLSEMVERIRRENSEKSAGHLSPDGFSGSLKGGATVKPSNGVAAEGGLQNGKAMTPGEVRDLQRALASALQDPDSRKEVLQQSAPYASMLGIVLLGVGIMAYLNGFQKVEN